MFLEQRDKQFNSREFSTTEISLQVWPRLAKSYEGLADPRYVLSTYGLSMYGLALHGASAAISTCDAWASSLAGLGKKQGPQYLVKSDPVPFLWRPFSKCPGVRS